VNISSSPKVGASQTEPNGFLVKPFLRKRRLREPNRTIWRQPNGRKKSESQTKQKEEISSHAITHEILLTKRHLSKLNPRKHFLATKVKLGAESQRYPVGVGTQGQSLGQRTSAAASTCHQAPITNWGPTNHPQAGKGLLASLPKL